MGDTLQRIACKAVILDKAGKVLILREAPTYDEGTNLGRYDLPGGRLDPGEPWREGLLREVLEETGLRVKIGQVIGVEEWFPVIHGQKNHVVAMFFLCEPLTNTIKLSNEHDKYNWVAPEDRSRYDIMEQTNSVLSQFFSKIDD